MKRILPLVALIAFTTTNLFAQNTCLTAMAVSAGSYTVDQINGEAHPEYYICSPNSGIASLGEWYTYTATQDTSVTISTDLPQNSGGDTRFNVYTGTCGQFSLTCEMGDDDSGSGLLSVGTFQAQQGVTYYIVFDNRWSANGFDFEVSLSAPIPPVVGFTPEVVSCVGCGRCIVDMDGDHLDDFVGITSTNIDMHFQQPGGGFVNSSVATTQADHPASWSMCAGDLDNNGFTDLVYAGGGGATMMIANNDGTAFTEISPTQYIFPQRSNTVDINNDGLLDVFVCHDVDSNVYFINDGIGGFVTHQGGLGDVPVGGNYGSIWSDMDNDGDIDMFIAKCGASNINEIHINNGDGTYTESGVQLNLNDPTQTWSCAVGDFDHDGDMDIVVTASSGSHRVVRNDITTFVDVTAGSGFDTFNATSIEWVSKDFDNDGHLDIMGAGHLMMGNGDLTFDLHPISISNGPVGDLNNDGFLDVANGNTIYYNDGNDNNWIKIHPVGTVSNIDGIGARVEIVTPSGTQIRDIRSGEGFGHMNSMTANFGIGTDTQVDQVTVYWPSGLENTIIDPAINQGHEIIEDQTTSITQISQEKDLEVYPNPVVNVLNLNGSSLLNGANYRVISSVGRTMVSGVLYQGNVDVSNLNAGAYLIQVQSTDGKIHRTQFVKAAR